MTRLTNCGPRVGESDVVAFEQRVGVALPSEYRQFLIQVNGGDGPPDESGYPPTRYFSLHWLGGPVSDADIDAMWADSMGWSDPDFDRDLEKNVRGLWRSGLARTWLPVASVHHECLLLLRLVDGTVWEMIAMDGFDEDRCTQVAASFGELGVTDADA